MARSRHREGQMIVALKQLDGQKAKDVAREVSVSKHALGAWGAKYGGTDLGQAQKAKQLWNGSARAAEAGGESEPHEETLQSSLRKNVWSCYPCPENLRPDNPARWTETEVFVREEPEEDDEEDDEEDEQDEGNEEGDDEGYSESSSQPKEPLCETLASGFAVVGLLRRSTSVEQQTA